jgi:uncharacterized protein
VGMKEPSASSRGLRADGTIAREGQLSRVQAPFAGLVDEARTRIAAVFPEVLLHSAYLYGSIPRGTAIVGSSDLDLQLALHREPTAEDTAQARELEQGLDADFDQIDGVGVLLSSARALLSEQERNDGGWFVACLCTPLLGPDLAEQLPRYRPTSLLARETNGDLALALPGWRLRAAETADPGTGAGTGVARRALVRRVARKIVRTGFTLVMPRWQGWTSDLGRSAEVFGSYYPDRASQMRRAALLATPRSADAADPADLAMLVDDLGPWLAAEYAAVHGVKSPCR